MGQAQIETTCLPLTKMLAANLAVSGFTNPPPRLIPLAAFGLVEVASARSSPNFGKFIFFGVGTATQTFGARIWGWHKAVSGANALWIPVCLADVVVTLGTTGPADGTLIAANNLFGSTIAVTTSIAAYDVLNGPANTLSLLRLDLTGIEQIHLDIGTGTATNGNALWGKF